MELDAGPSPAPPCLSARRKDWGGHAGLRHTVLAGNVPGGRRTARSIDTHPGLPVLICSLARISDPPWSRELARLCRVIHAEDVPEAEGRRRTDRRHATTAEQRRTRRRPYIGGQVGGGGGGRGAHLGGTVARPTKAARFPMLALSQQGNKACKAGAAAEQGGGGCAKRRCTSGGHRSAAGQAPRENADAVHLADRPAAPPPFPQQRQLAKAATPQRKQAAAATRRPRRRGACRSVSMVGAGQTPPGSQARGGTWRTGPCGPATSPPPPPQRQQAMAATPQRKQAAVLASLPNHYTTTG